MIVGYIEPFTSKRDNTMYFVNEGFVLLTNYTLFCFIDFVAKPDAKVYIGWTLIAFTCANIAINLGLMIAENMIKASKYLRLKYLRHLA
jgi:hypothetical protein